MERHKCTFQVAMIRLVRTGAILLIGDPDLLEGELESKDTHVKQRLKDLDAYRNEEVEGD